ncbi:MAG: hypothetical protein IT530_07110 [Burkholderiales bacterium]|nr:hypothetical protein [Burkholderiales bacterium]
MVPKVLDLVTNYEETAEFVRDIRRAALRDRRQVNLIFDEGEQIRPAALLLLLAEIHRCRMIHGTHSVTGNYPKNKRIERMLEDTGFFGLLSVKPQNPARARKYPVEFIKFRSDNKLDSAEPKRLRDDLLGQSITMHQKARTRLYRALTEAMINVGQHAYPQYAIQSHPTRGRWWVAGQVNKKRGEFLVTFCDLGVGIPETLPKIYPWELIRSVLALLPGVNPNDGEMIKAGMAIGRTQTGERYRGRGLNDLRSLIDQAGAGELLIFSRKGKYSYSPGRAEQVENYGISMGGTLIKWSVPLRNVTDWVDEDIHESDNHN